MNDQRSLTEQLIDLHALANRAGLYDAADWLQQKLADAAARSKAIHPSNRHRRDAS